MELVVTVVLLIAFATERIVRDVSVKSIASWVAAVSAIILAIILVF